MTSGDRSSGSDPDEEALRERIAELEDVLSQLRSDLHGEANARNRFPRPPGPLELLRFTERYTLPTLIALLEATIRSLELLRATLRLADPDRRIDGDGVGGIGGDGSHDRLADVRDGTAAGVRRTLSELRTALSETDLPREATSRELLEDARELSAEIDDLLAGESADRGGENGSDRADSGRDSNRNSNQGSSREEGVSIDVRDPDGPDAAEDRDSGEDDSAEDRDPDTDDSGADRVDEDPVPEVDVDAELASIKEELDEDGENGNADDGSAANDPDHENGANDTSDVDESHETNGSDDTNDADDPDDTNGTEELE